MAQTDGLATRQGRRESAALNKPERRTATRQVARGTVATGGVGGATCVRAERTAVRAGYDTAMEISRRPLSADSGDDGDGRKAVSDILGIGFDVGGSPHVLVAPWADRVPGRNPRASTSA